MKILSTLLTVRFRKLLNKNDKTAVVLLLLFYFAIAFGVFHQFEELGSWFYLLFVDVLVYHFKRQDDRLLKIHKNYKKIIFIEYLIYSFPFLLILLIKQHFLALGILMIAFWILPYLPKIQMKTIKLPFERFDPFWHIIFRKYHLFFIYIALLILSGIAIHLSNQNLLVVLFGSVVILCCLPGFERENILEIKISHYSSFEFLNKKMKTTFVNSLYLQFPFLLLLTINDFYWLNLFLFLLFMSIPLLNILLKYSNFQHPIKQQLLFIFGIFGFGIIYLMIPYLYKSSIRQINTIKNA